MNHKTVAAIADTLVPIIGTHIKRLDKLREETAYDSLQSHFALQKEVKEVRSRFEQQDSEVKVLILRIKELEQKLAAVSEVEPEFVSHVGMLTDRVEALEQRKPIVIEGPQGEPGKDGRDGIDGKDGIAGIDGKDGADGRHGQDGAPGERGHDGAPGFDGKDGETGPAGPRGEVGLTGKDGAPGLDGKDGASGLDGKDGAPGRDGERGEIGPEGQKGADGIAGRDGLPGLAGRDGTPGLNGKDGADGINGKDGLDGLGFDDLEMHYDGERTLVFSFVRGEVAKEFAFALPVPLDRGTWKDGIEYQRGDVVSFGSSFWIAQRATKEKPGDNGDWRLGVKRGRDGKDGARGERGLPGKDKQ